MRVTGGAARGRRLKSPRSGVRPTSDLVRAAIFDALDAQGTELARVLDLYAGSGALGIEALSRGALSCDFVERHAATAALIRENLALIRLMESGSVHRMSVEQAPDRLSGPYSLILADPPYDDDLAATALSRVAGSSLVDHETALMLEQSSRREAPADLVPLALTWNRRYGDTQVSIYRWQEGANERSSAAK